MEERFEPFNLELDALEIKWVIKALSDCHASKVPELVNYTRAKRYSSIANTRIEKLKDQLEYLEDLADKFCAISLILGEGETASKLQCSITKNERVQ